MADTDNGSIQSAASGEGASTSADTLAAEIQPTDATAAPPEKSSETLPPIQGDPWDAPFGESIEEKTETEKSDIKTDTPNAEQPESDNPLLDALFEDESVPAKAEDADSEKESAKSEELTDGQKREAEAEKLIEALPTSAARKAARVNEKKAEVIRQIQFNEISPEEFDGKLSEYNADFKAKYSQHAAYSLIASNPDASFQRAYVEKMRAVNPSFTFKAEELPTLENVIARLSEPVTTAQPAFAPSGEFTKTVDALDAVLGFDWRNEANDSEFLDERELALAKAVREAIKPQAQTAATEPENAELSAMKAKLEELENGRQNEEAQAFQSEVRKDVYEYRTEIETKLFPTIAKIHGLAAAETDTPQMKAYKEKLMTKYQGSDHDRAQGYASDFEVFATERSSVAADLTRTYERVTKAVIEAKQAEKAGDKTKAEKFRRAAQEEKATIYTLISRADKEFYASEIAPFMSVVQSLGAGLTKKINNAGKRIEVVSGASGAPAPPPKAKNYASADDVWNAMPEEILADQRLRA